MLNSTLFPVAEEKLNEVISNCDDELLKIQVSKELTLLEKICKDIDLFKETMQGKYYFDENGNTIYQKDHNGDEFFAFYNGENSISVMIMKSGKTNDICLETFENEKPSKGLKLYTDGTILISYFDENGDIIKSKVI